VAMGILVLDFELFIGVPLPVGDWL
jgi:hypothetical protein